jgi:hypothetical protein
VSHSKQHCAAVKNTAESGLSHAENKVIAIQSTAKNNAASLKAHVIKAADTHKEHIEGAKATRTSAHTTLASISGSVTEKRTFLDKTVDTLVGDVGTAIASASEVVGQTSETATNILRDVTNATQRMTKSTSESIDSLTTFLDNQGDRIDSNLNSHFVELTHHVDGPQVATDALVDDVVSFGEESIESKLKATGKTPKKTGPFKPLEKLAVTRDHETIKADARNGVLNIEVSSVLSVGSLSIDIEEETIATSLDSVSTSTASPVKSPIEESVSSSSFDAENGDPNQVQAKPSMLQKKSARTSKKEADAAPAETAAKRSSRAATRVA